LAVGQSKSEKQAKVTSDRQFDYSGSQCLKAIQEEGIKSVLVNPNIATIQTDTRFADKVYSIPVNSQYVESIIEAERPDGLMLGFGGQTALNCGVKIDDLGILKKYGVKVLGTQVKGIQATEDRQLFKDSMIACNVPVLKSKTVYNFEDAKKIANELGYPVIIRVAYTLGGKGGGVAHNEIELHEIVSRGLNASLVGQVLIEEYVGHWKQIEYEVMADYLGNNVVICNMENVLSMRVHTGDNIVVAPSQTLDNYEYQLLRSAALRAAKHVGIVGECNVQFALDPDSDKYVAIEMNPRLSRSSALASKATGYPIAYMAAKIVMGYTLPELVNRITKTTTACFEPSLDYIVCKHPRWDFSKFELAKRNLGPTMKSVGEVMAIGRCFEESLQKSIRMLEIGNDGLVANRNSNKKYDIEELENKLQNPDDRILYYVAEAIKQGISVEQIYKLSAIDPWFIEKIVNIVESEKKLTKSKLDNEILREAKVLGFSDKQIGRITGKDEMEIRKTRKQAGILPVVKRIDTLAAEWPAQTNYLYLTYGGNVNDFEIKPNSQKIAVLGAGPYRIGSSVEFDWGTVNMVWGLKENGVKEVSVINCNPETVSTDYDICDRLYFEELTLERVLDIAEFEKLDGIVTAVGGQTANNLTPKLAKNGINIVGTSFEDIDRAENRSTFSKVLDDLNIRQPPWQAFSNLIDAKKFAIKVGYPVLVRPSYVLSGAAMKVVWSETQLKKYLQEATNVSPDYPVVITKFMLNSLEAEVDGVGNGETVVIGAVIEHIEGAGIHSGDSMMCIPPWTLSNKVIDTILNYTEKVASAFKIKGPFNLQFLINQDQVYVIELNIRASRSMPFVSKFVRMNLINLAAKAVLGKPLPIVARDRWRKIQHYGIKVPQFSFMQLEGADVILGVEMQSTGEAACFGESFYDALAKGLTSVGYALSKEGSVLISAGGSENKEKLLQTALLLKSLGYKLLATEHTAQFLSDKRIGDVEVVYKISEPERKPNIADLLYERKIDFIINVPSTSTLEKYVGMLYDEYQIRRKAVELGIPVLITTELADSFAKTLEWLKHNETTKKPLESYEKVD
jgi:carbamoyl-phosphate synthase large subunit